MQQILMENNVYVLITSVNAHKGEKQILVIFLS